MNAEDIVNLAIPVLPILAPIGIHFLLVCFALTFSWLPLAYLFSHLVLIGVGLWATHVKTEVIPVIVFIFVLLVSGLIDIISLSVYFPDQQRIHGSGDNKFSRTWQFSATMCIINLLFKPLTFVLACITVFIRSGGKVPGLTDRNRNGYSQQNESDERGYRSPQ